MARGWHLTTQGSSDRGPWGEAASPRAATTRSIAPLRPSRSTLSSSSCWPTRWSSRRRFTFSGLVNRVGRWLFLVACVLAVLPTRWLPVERQRPSDVGLWVVYLSGYVPSLPDPGVRRWTGMALAAAAAAAGLLRSRCCVPSSAASGSTLPGGQRCRAAAVRLAPSRAGRRSRRGQGRCGSSALPTGLPSLDSVAEARIDFREELAGRPVDWLGTRCGGPARSSRRCWSPTGSGSAPVADGRGGRHRLGPRLRRRRLPEHDLRRRCCSSGCWR